MLDRVAVAPDTADPAVAAAVVARARQRGFRRFVLASGVPVSAVEGEEVLRRDADRIVSGPDDRAGYPVVRVGDPAALAAAIARTADGATLVVEWTGDRVIPLENAVAHRGRRFSLWSYAGSPREVPAAIAALEHGADRVVAVVRSPDDVDRLEAALEHHPVVALDWTRVPLTAVEPAGVGDRVLVDTTSLLRPEEGLLVGSSAALLFHVASEAVGSEFSRPRAFRVNAGASHSYVLLADGTTRYLAELEAGDAVLAVAPESPPRSVRVGRVKIERRPLVLLRATDGAQSRTVFLQEAETVRLSSGGGRVAVTHLRPPSELCAVRLPAARHLGTAVEETIIER